MLVRGAAALDLSRAMFADDLAKLPAELGLEVLLTPGYEAGKARVRAEIEEGSLAAHGARFEGLEWRLDAMISTSRFRRVAMPVATLTLHDGKGKRRRALTLQATLSEVLEIERACARIREDALAASPRPEDASGPE